MQFDANQRAEALELIEKLPWGDMDMSIRTLEEALRLAMEATRDEFALWEQDAEAMDPDEFALEPATIAGLSPEQRLAYVARLLRSLAMAHGVSTDFAGGALVFDEDRNTPAGLLRGLNDLLWMGARPNETDQA